MDVARSTAAQTVSGSLPRPGVIVRVSDEWGLAAQTVSGSSPEHGQGGFKVEVWGTGRYTISFLDAVFQLNIDSDGAFVSFAQ
jgi:hypothetical protein